jgi:hypothetical protein
MWFLHGKVLLTKKNLHRRRRRSQLRCRARRRRTPTRRSSSPRTDAEAKEAAAE